MDIRERYEHVSKAQRGQLDGFPFLHGGTSIFWAKVLRKEMNLLAYTP